MDTSERSRQAKVTDEHRKESARLKEIWEAKTGKPSQMKFGEDYGIGTQGAVWRFLNGRDPLSLKAAMGFAAGLDCRVSDFSERLASEAAAIGIAAGGAKPAAKSSAVQSLLELNEQEAQLMLLFRDLTPEQKDALLLKANKLHVQSHPKKSKANPFAHLPVPPQTEKT